MLTSLSLSTFVLAWRLSSLLSSLGSFLVLISNQTAWKNWLNLGMLTVACHLGAGVQGLDGEAGVSCQLVALKFLWPAHLSPTLQWKLLEPCVSSTFLLANLIPKMYETGGGIDLEVPMLLIMYAFSLCLLVQQRPCLLHMGWRGT